MSDLTAVHPILDDKDRREDHQDIINTNMEVGRIHTDSTVGGQDSNVLGDLVNVQTSVGGGQGSSGLNAASEGLKGALKAGTVINQTTHDEIAAMRQKAMNRRVSTNKHLDALTAIKRLQVAQKAQVRRQSEGASLGSLEQLQARAGRTSSRKESLNLKGGLGLPRRKSAMDQVKDMCHPTRKEAEAPALFTVLTQRGLWETIQSFTDDEYLHFKYWIKWHFILVCSPIIVLLLWNLGRNVEYCRFTNLDVEGVYFDNYPNGKGKGEFPVNIGGALIGADREFEKGRKITDVRLGLNTFLLHADKTLNRGLAQDYYESLYHHPDMTVESFLTTSQYFDPSNTYWSGVGFSDIGADGVIIDKDKMGHYVSGKYDDRQELLSKLVPISTGPINNIYHPSGAQVLNGYSFAHYLSSPGDTYLAGDRKRVTETRQIYSDMEGYPQPKDFVYYLPTPVFFLAMDKGLVVPTIWVVSMCVFYTMVSTKWKYMWFLPTTMGSYMVAHYAYYYMVGSIGTATFHSGYRFPFVALFFLVCYGQLLIRGYKTRDGKKVTARASLKAVRAEMCKEKEIIEHQENKSEGAGNFDLPPGVSVGQPVIDLDQPKGSMGLGSMGLAFAASRRMSSVIGMGIRETFDNLKESVLEEFRFEDANDTLEKEADRCLSVQAKVEEHDMDLMDAFNPDSDSVTDSEDGEDIQMDKTDPIAIMDLHNKNQKEGAHESCHKSDNDSNVSLCSDSHSASLNQVTTVEGIERKDEITIYEGNHCTPIADTTNTNDTNDDHEDGGVPSIDEIIEDSAFQIPPVREVWSLFRPLVKLQVALVLLVFGGLSLTETLIPMFKDYIIRVVVADRLDWAGPRVMNEVGVGFIWSFFFFSIYIPLCGKIIAQFSMRIVAISLKVFQRRGDGFDAFAKRKSQRRASRLSKMSSDGNRVSRRSSRCSEGFGVGSQSCNRVSQVSNAKTVQSESSSGTTRERRLSLSVIRHNNSSMIGKKNSTSSGMNVLDKEKAEDEQQDEIAVALTAIRFAVNFAIDLPRYSFGRFLLMKFLPITFYLMLIKDTFWQFWYFGFRQEEQFIVFGLKMCHKDGKQLILSRYWRAYAAFCWKCSWLVYIPARCARAWFLKVVMEDQDPTLSTASTATTASVATNATAVSQADGRISGVSGVSGSMPAMNKSTTNTDITRTITAKEDSRSGTGAVQMGMLEVGATGSARDLFSVAHKSSTNTGKTSTGLAGMRGYDDEEGINMPELTDETSLDIEKRNQIDIAERKSIKAQKSVKISADGAENKAAPAGGEKSVEETKPVEKTPSKRAGKHLSVAFENTVISVEGISARAWIELMQADFEIKGNTIVAQNDVDDSDEDDEEDDDDIDAQIAARNAARNAAFSDMMGEKKAGASANLAPVSGMETKLNVIKGIPMNSGITTDDLPPVHVPNNNVFCTPTTNVLGQNMPIGSNTVADRHIIIRNKDGQITGGIGDVSANDEIMKRHHAGNEMPEFIEVVRSPMKKKESNEKKKKPRKETEEERAARKEKERAEREARREKRSAEKKREEEKRRKAREEAQKKRQEAREEANNEEGLAAEDEELVEALNEEPNPTLLVDESSDSSSESGDDDDAEECGDQDGDKTGANSVAVTANKSVGKSVTLGGSLESDFPLEASESLNHGVDKRITTDSDALVDKTDTLATVDKNDTVNTKRSSSLFARASSFLVPKRSIIRTSRGGSLFGGRSSLFGGSGRNSSLSGGEGTRGSVFGGVAEQVQRVGSLFAGPQYDEDGNRILDEEEHAEIHKGFVHMMRKNEANKLDLNEELVHTIATEMGTSYMNVSPLELHAFRRFSATYRSEIFLRFQARCLSKMFCSVMFFMVPNFLAWVQSSASRLPGFPREELGSTSDTLISVNLDGSLNIEYAEDKQEVVRTSYWIFSLTFLVVDIIEWYLITFKWQLVTNEDYRRNLIVFKKIINFSSLRHLQCSLANSMRARGLMMRQYYAQLKENRRTEIAARLTMMQEANAKLKSEDQQDAVVKRATGITEDLEEEIRKNAEIDAAIEAGLASAQNMSIASLPANSQISQQKSATDSSSAGLVVASQGMNGVMKKKSTTATLSESTKFNLDNVDDEKHNKTVFRKTGAGGFLSRVSTKVSSLLRLQSKNSIPPQNRSTMVLEKDFDTNFKKFNNRQFKKMLKNKGVSSHVFDAKFASVYWVVFALCVYFGQLAFRRWDALGMSLMNKESKVCNEMKCVFHEITWDHYYDTCEGI